MNILFQILIIFILLFYNQDKNSYYNNGRPSSWGIEKFIKENEKNLIKEYEYKIDSFLFDIYIETEDLSKLSDYEIFEMGRFYAPDQIIITNEEKYIEYEFKNLSKFKQKNISYNERTVKAILFHELSHAYFNQILLEMKQNNEKISSEYSYIRIFPQVNKNLGSEFIEDGICEYILYKTKEMSEYKVIFIPKNINELLDLKNTINIKYHYSVNFLKPLLDTMDLKKGIQMLISNNPPKYEEILNPKLFYKRLNYDTRN
jgi:hypothetical protein